MLTPTNVELVLDVLAGVVVADDECLGALHAEQAEYLMRRRNADFDDTPETAAALAHVTRRLAVVAPPPRRGGKA